MDVGALRIRESFPHTDVLERCMNAIPEEEWRSVHPDGGYASTGWKAARLLKKKGHPTDLLDQIPEVREALAWFECPILAANFNSMDPGAWIKPHRDMSGTLEWGRIRLHVPLVTDPGVDFRVDHERVEMRRGELWALNASHIHQVENPTDIVRVHFIVECKVNDWVRDLLPTRSLTYYRNAAVFFAHASLRVARKGLRDPKYLKQVGSMTRRYVLGRGDPTQTTP